MELVRLYFPKNMSVVLLEDSPMRITWFSERVPGLNVCRTFPEFKAYMDKRPPCDYIFLDHDLGFLDAQGNPGPEGNGLMAAEYLKTTFGANGHHTLIHSFNSGGAIRMKQVLPQALVVPFGDFELEVKG